MSNVLTLIYRLTLKTMLSVREWERYKFVVDFQHRQVWDIETFHLEFPNFESCMKNWNQNSRDTNNECNIWQQQKEILRRPLPDTLKLSIAQKIEDNLFSRVPQATRIMKFRTQNSSISIIPLCCRFLSWLDLT